MEPDRFQRVEALYHAALAREANVRAAFLDEACGDDEALRREVESLLAHEEEAKPFLSTPALEMAARMIDDSREAWDGSLPPRTHAKRGFKRKAAPTPGDDIDQQLGVLPVLELLCPDVERRAADLAEAHVTFAYPELAPWEAHRGTAIAASTRLVKEQRPVLRTQLAQHALGRFRDDDARNALPRRVDHRASQKKPSFLGL